LQLPTKIFSKDLRLSLKIFFHFETNYGSMFPLSPMVISWGIVFAGDSCATRRLRPFGWMPFYDLTASIITLLVIRLFSARIRGRAIKTTAPAKGNIKNDIPTLIVSSDILLFDRV
jgi:hypothetical protein